MRPQGTKFQWCEACGKHKVFYTRGEFVCMICGSVHKNNNPSGKPIQLVLVIQTTNSAVRKHCSLCNRLLIEGMIGQNPKHCSHCDPNYDKHTVGFFK